MSLNTVNVVIAADVSPADLATAEGNAIAVPTGTEWPDTSQNPIVPAVVHGTLESGTTTLVLVASDNFSAGVLTWDFIINIRGIPTVNVPGVVVNFSNGATQNVWTLLSAAGWTPQSET
jgi:hypothetical protein